MEAGTWMGKTKELRGGACYSYQHHWRRGFYVPIPRQGTFSPKLGRVRGNGVGNMGKHPNFRRAPLASTQHAHNMIGRASLALPLNPAPRPPTGLCWSLKFLPQRYCLALIPVISFKGLLTLTLQKMLESMEQVFYSTAWGLRWAQP